jgi:hypothetical protein
VANTLSLVESSCFVLLLGRYRRNGTKFPCQLNVVTVLLLLVPRRVISALGETDNLQVDPDSRKSCSGPQRPQPPSAALPREMTLFLALQIIE